MTGIYVRIKRGSEWQNLEFDQLTDEEMEAFIEMKLEKSAENSREGWNWAIALAKWIRDNVASKPPPDLDPGVN